MEKTLNKPSTAGDLGMESLEKTSSHLVDQYLIWHTHGSNISVERCLEGLISQRISISLEFLQPRPPKVQFLTLSGGQLNDAVDTKSLW